MHRFAHKLFSTTQKTTTKEGKREYMCQYMRAYRNLLKKDKKITTLCENCSNYFSFLLVGWGRELTEIEKDVNTMLIKEGKAEMCQAYNRYFNKSFRKRTKFCEEALEET